MKLARINIWIVRILNFFFLIISTGLIIANYFNQKIKGGVSDLSEYLSILIQKKTYLFIILVILSTLGLIIKKTTGWIFTSLLFYTVTIVVLYFSMSLNYNFFEITTFFLFSALMIYSVLILNTRDFLSFYKIEKTKRKVLINNLITIFISLYVVTILYLTNEM
jgi:hypothetical protein